MWFVALEHDWGIVSAATKETAALAERKDPLFERRNADGLRLPATQPAHDTYVMEVSQDVPAAAAS